MKIQDAVGLFERDLWKDQRVLECKKIAGQQIMVKHYDTSDELQTEVSVSHYLNEKGVEGIPPIEKDKDATTVMPYYSGIRLFNLFVELDALRNDYNDKISSIKRELINRCEQRQMMIQSCLIDWRETQNGREAYPHAKIKSIIDILSFCLGIDIDESVIDGEIASINEYWQKTANVPFRDATPKNMILNSPKLYMENYDSDEERSAYIAASIKNGTYKEWMESQIIDIDFSSCIHDTTYEDDVISLKFHERTWEGAIPSANELLWHGEVNNKRAAITFLIRYFRFGGRKAAYKLMNPRGHRIRFKYDNEQFYFSRLGQILISLWPGCSSEFPNILKFIDTAAKYLPMKNVTTDLFQEYRLKKPNYYTDVFPY